jgi:phenylacetate-CoA ligase
VRLVISGTTGADVMLLKVEAAETGQALIQSLTNTVRDVTKLRAEVAIVPVGSLPNDGKVIEDLRTYT